MNNTDNIPATTPDDIPPPRHGCLSALMVIVGVILLLPGVCALYFGSFSLTHPDSPDRVTPFVVVGLLVGFGGVMLIWSAIRGRRR
jgi:hypothetical protein